MQQSQYWLNLSVNIYVALLKAYPPQHRLAFSDEMRQVFRDLCREMYEKHGLAGLTGLWVKTLIDLLKTALEERLREAAHMTKEKFIRLGAWSLILAGLLVMIYVMGVNYRPIGRVTARAFTDLIFFYGNTLFFAMGLLALYARYQRDIGALGNASLLVGAIMGLLWFGVVLLFSLFDPPSSLDNVDYAFIITGWLFPLSGLFFFGVDVLKRKYPMQWKILPLVPGLAMFIFLFVGGLNGGNMPEPGASFLMMVIGLGSILIGYFLQADSKPEIVEVNAEMRKPHER